MRISLPNSLFREKRWRENISLLPFVYWHVAVFGPATRPQPVLQAIALFLERQSDVQYADELLNMLDQHATPIDIYVQAGGGSVIQLKYWSIAYVHYSPQKLLYRPEGIQK